MLSAMRVNRAFAQCNPGPLQHIALSRHALGRRFQSTSTPLDLEYTVVAPSTSNETERPLVFLHGFFGNKRNFGSLTKALSRRLKRPVYALDLRNHGHSPTDPDMSYAAMASDVKHFMESRGLTDVSLVGHSMGGKVAMSVALAQPENLKNLIVVDVSPIRKGITQQFLEYVNTLQEIEKLGLASKRDADNYLARVERDAGVRAFLLTNLKPFDENEPRASFRVPLDIFKAGIAEIWDFPYAPGESKWDGRTLFIKGSRSQYVKDANLPIIEKFFPHYQLQELKAGHWVHAEQPQRFVEVISEFIEAADR